MRISKTFGLLAVTMMVLMLAGCEEQLERMPMNATVRIRTRSIKQLERGPFDMEIEMVSPMFALLFSKQLPGKAGGAIAGSGGELLGGAFGEIMGSKYVEQEMAREFTKLFDEAFGGELEYYSLDVEIIPGGVILIKMRDAVFTGDAEQFEDMMIVTEMEGLYFIEAILPEARELYEGQNSKLELIIDSTVYGRFVDAQPGKVSPDGKKAIFEFEGPAEFDRILIVIKPGSFVLPAAVGGGVLIALAVSIVISVRFVRRVTKA